jgi:hypothetical protein
VFIVNQPWKDAPSERETEEARPQDTLERHQPAVYSSLLQ